MADASHELRTPVSVVRATADVTLSREHRDEAEYREAMAIVGGQARRLGGLVEDMLVLARADAGGYPLRPVDLYLDEVVADCRRAVDVLATERGVTIRSAGSPDIPFRGDEDLLRRLVLNVLQNAVQHTPSGGSVAVEIRQDLRRCESASPTRAPGIPADDRERIFDRFVQLDAARRARAPVSACRSRAGSPKLTAARWSSSTADPAARRSACRCQSLSPDRGSSFSVRRFRSSSLNARTKSRKQNVALRKAVDEDFRDAVDDAEQRGVAGGERGRRERRARASASRRSRGRRRVVEQALHARGDVAAVDQRADRLGDRIDRRRQARDLHQRRCERASRLAAVAGAAIGGVLGRRGPAPLERARGAGAWRADPARRASRAA